LGCWVDESRSGKGLRKESALARRFVISSRNLMLNSIVRRNDGNKDEKHAIRWVGAFAALLAVLCFSASAARGQEGSCSLSDTPTSWNVSGAGDWATASDRSTDSVPDSRAYQPRHYQCTGKIFGDKATKTLSLIRGYPRDKSDAVSSTFVPFDPAPLGH